MINEIIQAISVHAKPLTGDEIIEVIGGEQAVLAPTALSVKNQSITTEKIKPGTAKQLLVTDATGEVKWVDATDEVIKEAVQANEKVTILEDNHNGTFTYYNEKAIDEQTGMPIRNLGVVFDANTLRIKEREAANEKGIYDFYDGMTTLANPLITISTRANSIYIDNSSTIIEGDNLQSVIENIIAKIEVAQTRPSALSGEGILVNGDPSLAGAVLKEVLLTIADGAIVEQKLANNAVTTYKINDKAVTSAKIAPGPDKNLLVTKDGEVQWIPVTDEIMKEIVTKNETITILDTSANNGTFIYYNESDFDANGILIGSGTAFDANTLTISNNGEGKYVFRDQKTQTGTPLAEIDIVGTVIENITEILDNQTVVEEIYEKIAAEGKALTNEDASILVEGGDAAVLHATKISVANQGITPAKIAPGGDKFILVTKNGQVEWVPASDEVIKEIVDYNEKITILTVDQQQGTFVYYNEESVDSNGQITGAGVAFDANTLTIADNGAGKYVFRDGHTRTGDALAEIDILGTVVENITEILSKEEVRNEIFETVAAQGKDVTSTNGSIAIVGGDKATLKEMQLTIAPDGVTTITIASQAVTTDKIAPGLKKGQLLVTNENREVQWMDASDPVIKEILKGNQAITYVEDNQNGTFTYFNEACFDKDGNLVYPEQAVTFNANTLRIVEVEDDQGNGTGVFQFFDESSDTHPISTINVTASVINNIDQILQDVHVQESIYTTVANKGQRLANTDGSLAITGGDKAVLEGVDIKVEEQGIQTIHLGDGTVTTAKINTEHAEKGTVLTSDGLGNAFFQPTSEAVIPAMQGDLAGEAGVISILGGGENVIFGDQNKKVTIAINKGGVKGSHIGNRTITNDNIANQTIQATKLSGIGEQAGAVATVNANGTVSYLPLKTEHITDKGSITTDGIIAVSDNGQDKVLSDVHLSIETKSITADKLSAQGAVNGAVATANADGTVTYQPLKGENLADKAALKTDGIIRVDGVNEQNNTLLKEAMLSIAEQSITATQIADHTITNDQIALNTITVDKISAGNEPPKRVMVIDEFGTVKWGELDDIVTDAAGNLTTDTIIEIQDGDGVNSLFNDVKLGIKEGSITNTQIKDQTIQIEKLSSEGAGTDGMILVSTLDGGFEFVAKESVTSQGYDLKVEPALEFTQGNGKDAVLVPTTIGVKNGGITEAKLGDHAVTTSKISSQGADENAVLTADGQGNVAYKKINTAAFEDGASDLKSDGSLRVPLHNKALLSEVEISIASSGVQNQHLADQSVTVSKINSEAAATGTVLSADGLGNTSFKTLNAIANEQGKAITSEEQSLTIAPNKAALQELSIDVAESGIKTKHIENQAVSPDKISSLDSGEGLVLTSDGEGGAAFLTLGDVLSGAGKTIASGPSITVVGGEQAALQDVSIDVANFGITENKIDTQAVSTAKIKDKAVTTQKIAPEGSSKILGTDSNGVVKWMSSTDELIKVIVKANESITKLVDNGNGTITYYNESQVDSSGNLIPNAKGVDFDANTLSISQTEPFVYVFKDRLDPTGQTILATIDTRAKSIVFEDNSIVYNNVEEAIISLTQKIEQLENLDIEKAPLSGDGILINGQASVADAVFKDITLSIEDEAVTPAKIKGGTAKQLLITNTLGKAQWVDKNDPIIKEIVQSNEKVTVLEVQANGTFVYYSEEDIDAQGNIVGSGTLFDANTLTIEDQGNGAYAFYDKSQAEPLEIIDIPKAVIENITELLNNISVKQEIFNVVAAQGKNVTADQAIEITGGTKAALAEMTIGLKDGGVTTEKVASQAITADKLWAGEDKANYVPIVQNDGSVAYQPMTVAVTGQPLTVDSSLAITGEGNASRAVLEKIGLQIKEDGIETKHLKNLAVTAAKINSQESQRGTILAADGSGNAAFTPASTLVQTAMQGDLVSDTSLVVENGENVLFGDNTTQVKVKINEGGVTGTHIASQVVKNDHLVNKTIQANKLTAGTGVENRVALADATGTVTYNTLSTQVLTGKGNITSDGTIAVSDNGVGKVLEDVKLGINDHSIKATKLDGGGAPEGAIATVGANGVSVSYLPLTANHLTNKGNITTDNIIVASENGVGKVLQDVNLSIKPKGIGTAQLADQAVTNAQVAEVTITSNKLSSQGVTAKSVLISGDNNEVVWGELGDIVTDTAGNLTTDNIIEMTNGNGVNTLLKDVTLGIKEQSITHNKLSSKEGDANVAIDHVLVTDGQGGFSYASREAVEVGGVDLNLGNALAFADGTTGLNAVLAPTKIDVKDGGIQTAKLADGAVTVGKMTAGNAAVNSVLTAKANGTVAYEALNENAFAGNGADLVSDSSIKVIANNKALLTETSIAIADSGVKNNHLNNLAVTTAKISSKVGTTNAANGTILAADGSGNTNFKTLTELATAQGKAVSSDGSLSVTSNNKAVLQNVEIKVAREGIENKHIGEREVTADKIGTSGISKGLVLTADGQGAAQFKSVDEAIAGAGKTMQEGAGIAIEGGVKAALQDVKISVANRGIDNPKIADGAVNARTIAAKAVGTAELDTRAVTGEKIAEETITFTKIADYAIRKNHIYNSNIEEIHFATGAVSKRALASKAVTVAKIDAESATTGHVLTVESNGNVAFKAPTGASITTGNLTSKEASLFDIENGSLALLKDVKLDIKGGGIKTKHIADKAVGTAELKDEAVTTAKIADGAVGTAELKSGAVTAAKIAAKAVGTGELADNGVTQAKLATNSVGYDQLKVNSVYDNIIEDKGVKEAKINSGNASSGYVLTANGSGGASFKPASGSNASGELYGDGPISVTDGANAIMHDVHLDIKLRSIDTEYIANDAVGFNQLKGGSVYGNVIKDQAVTRDKIGNNAVGYNQLDNESVYGSVIKDKAITTSKIAGNAVGYDELDRYAVHTNAIKPKGVDSSKIDSGNSRSGYVLTSDGNGGATFEAPQGGGSSEAGMPKFFYLPAMYVPIVSGGSGSLRVYDEYREQFGSPMVSNSGAGSSPSLPVMGRSELNYHVTYYDTAIFYDVSMSNDGVMSYKMRTGVQPTGKTFFNIVLEVK
ncbi:MULTISPECIES: beta strand repeat-containing protein [unclassified Myroides]|uniref:beta strand repeat-containing protein n=1 Tax=unclassified Myroides TaxID=2642485 RepID=UPI003D2F522D